MVRDDEFKQLIQQEMDREADEIMEEVNRDPSMKDVEAPNEIYEKLSAQIRLYEEQKSYKSLPQEDDELIRLGKLYKKRRRLNIYLILAAAIVLALGVCMSSMGGTKQALRKITFWLEGKEYMLVNMNNDSTPKELSEEEAFEEIKETWGFYPVWWSYRPEGTEFYKLTIMKEVYSALMIYKVGEKGMIYYRILPNYVEGSIGITLDDEYVRSYEIEVGETMVTAAEFEEKETQTKRWRAYYTHENTYYEISFVNVKEAEIQNIIKNLKIY